MNPLKTASTPPNKKRKSKSRNDELAELVEDLSIEKKKAQNEKALEEDSKPVAEMPLAGQAEVKSVGQFVYRVRCLQKLFEHRC